jgi:heavy metal sensor kinase
MIQIWPRHVRSRLTLWYVLVLGLLLVLYAGGASLSLFVGLREEVDRNLLDDVETVEGLLSKTPDGLIALRALDQEQNKPTPQRSVEVWSPEGSLLYRSPQIRDRVLGGPPQAGEGKGEPHAVSRRLADGARVRVASSVYHVANRPVVLRVAHSEEGLWREMGELLWILGLVFPPSLVFAGFGGYALARKALAPIDSMTRQAERISAERLSDRLPIENPYDELGKLANVFNAMLGRLEAAFDQLRRFTADASHELRTPLTAIRSVGEVALQHQKNTEEYRDVIGSMLEEVDRLTRLAESLLVLSRADAGHIRLQRADISLLHLAQEAGALIEVLAEEKRQRIAVEGDAALVVSGDRLILCQAIVNLLDNAIKYSPVGSQILIRVRSSENGYAVLEVVDQGPGVPPEHRAHIFDRFYRADSARTREWGGAGLGLSIARWAVEAHDGQIGVESVEGRGSTFWIHLPGIRAMGVDRT